jgi:hypothetical protein
MADLQCQKSLGKRRLVTSFHDLRLEYILKLGKLTPTFEGSLQHV